MSEKIIGLMMGYDDGSFKPDNNVTRAEFVCALVKAMNYEITQYDGMFSDVESEDWYQGYIAAAVAKGIINGFEDGTFCPDDCITREQIAVIISNAAGLSEKTFLSFSDNEQIGDWSYDAVSKVCASGIMQGRDGNAFAPKANATRAEMAAILQRVLER